MSKAGWFSYPKGIESLISHGKKGVRFTFSVSKNRSQSPLFRRLRTGSPLRRPCQQGWQNSSRVPGFTLFLLTRSWLDRPRLCSRVAAALGRTSHHFGL